MSEIIIHGNELYHHGIKGQKWGVRRYQNEDGTYTQEGKERYYGYKGGKFKGHERSYNPFLGRKMLADKQTRVDRGEILRKQGRTIPGVAGRALGRQFVASIGPSAIQTAALLTGNPALIAAGTAAGWAYKGYTVSNLIRMAQDIVDISEYKNEYNKVSRKK